MHFHRHTVQMPNIFKCCAWAVDKNQLNPIDRLNSTKFQAAKNRHFDLVALVKQLVVCIFYQHKTESWMVCASNMYLTERNERESFTFGNKAKQLLWVAYLALSKIGGSLNMAQQCDRQLKYSIRLATPRKCFYSGFFCRHFGFDGWSISIVLLLQWKSWNE